MSAVGFIGLGIMGSPMAVHLQQEGHQVSGFNRSDRSGPLVEAGGRKASSIADAVSAEMTARLNARAPREASRAVVTTLPFLSVVAYADASLTTYSGVTSTLTRPETPRGPKRDDEPRDSQITLEVTTAPASTASGWG